MKLSTIGAAVSLTLLSSLAHAAVPVCTDKTFSVGSLSGSSTVSVSAFCFGAVDGDKSFTATYTFSTATAFKIDGVLPLLQNVDSGGVFLTGGSLGSPFGLNSVFNTHQYGDPNAEVRYSPAGAFAAGNYALTFSLNGAAYTPAAPLTRGFSGEVFISAVPEPETDAMMLAGLGAIGFMARRRKQG